MQGQSQPHILYEIKSLYSDLGTISDILKDVTFDRYLNLPDELESVKEKATEENNVVNSVEKEIYSAVLAAEDERFYDSYRRLVYIAPALGEKRTSIEKLHNFKRERIKKEIARYIMDELWGNSREGMNFRTESAKNKALNEAEKLLSGENKYITYYKNKGVFEQQGHQKKRMGRKTVLENANEEGYLENIEHYETWKYDSQKILKKEEEVAERSLEIAKKCKEKARQKGEKELEKRPVVLLNEKDMLKAEKLVKEKGLGYDGVETQGAFRFRNLGGKRFYLHNFFNVESEDERGKSSVNDEAFRIGLKTPDRGEEEVIHYHSHVERKLGYGKEDMMSQGWGDTRFLGGHNEGWAIVAVPWSEKPIPEDKVVWFAQLVKVSQGSESGLRGPYLPIKVIKVNEDTGEDIDYVDVSSNYDWAGIYNDRLKYTSSTKLGPYWVNLVEEKDYLDPRDNFRKGIKKFHE